MISRINLVRPMRKRNWLDRVRNQVLILRGAEIIKLIAIGYVAGLLVGFLARGYI